MRNVTRRELLSIAAAGAVDFARRREPRRRRRFPPTKSSTMASVLWQCVEGWLRSAGGRPPLGPANAYILGQEASGAFVGGLRFGEGKMYTRNAGNQTIYWQGPSIGFDAGADGDGR